ncbi:unnamed protein product [Ascophyllum nodosum]
MVAEGQANTKTRKRTEGAAKAVQAKHGDSWTVQRVQDGPKTSTCLSVMAEPPDLPCREDVLVENGATAPTLCLPTLERRTTIAAGGLHPTRKASIAARIIYNQPPLRLYSTEETNSKGTNLRTQIPYLSFDSSFLSTAHSCRRVIETKSMQNRMFNPGGFQGRLRACLFLGT